MTVARLQPPDYAAHVARMDALRAQLLLGAWRLVEHDDLDVDELDRLVDVVDELDQLRDEAGPC